jgi:hypothetical protein
MHITGTQKIQNFNLIPAFAEHRDGRLVLPDISALFHCHRFWHGKFNQHHGHINRLYAILIISNMLLLNQNHLQATAHHGIHAIGKGKIQSEALEAG